MDLFKTLGLLIALSAPVAPAWSGCRPRTLTELPVTVVGMRPMLQAGINGSEASFVVDSGAAWSVITRERAEEAHLTFREPPRQASVLMGLGGEQRASMTSIRSFTIADRVLHEADFMVVRHGLGSGISGFLGQNLLEGSDVEYDLANGVIRLMKPEGCGHDSLAYWVQSPSPAYSILQIEHATPESPFIKSLASVNGQRIRVLFDTGTASTIIDRVAARSLGLVLQGKGNGPAVYTRAAIGPDRVDTWLTSVETL
jgi:hypothetical protein